VEAQGRPLRCPRPRRVRRGSRPTEQDGGVQVGAVFPYPTADWLTRMSSLAQIREGLADTVRTYVNQSGDMDLYCYPYVKGSVNLPCVLVMPGGGGRDNKAGDFAMTMERGTEKWSFQLIVLCSRSDEDSGQIQLDQLIDKAGDLSIRQAIWNTPDLGL